MDLYKILFIILLLFVWSEVIFRRIILGDFFFNMFKKMKVFFIYVNYLNLKICG